MNSGDSTGLGGPLKKPAAKMGAGKPLGGGLSGGGAGKSLGGSDAPAPAPAAPAAPMSFEFEDAPEAKPADKKPAAPASFNPFADQPVAVPAGAAATTAAPAAPGTSRSEKPSTARVEKPATGRSEKPGTARVEKPATGRSEKPGTGTMVKAPAPTSDDGDIAPGLAKDLWLCPHCGAKNKPHRETCRECKKSPADPVAKPWFLNPAIVGPVVGGVILLVVMVMWLTNVDLSLHSAGVVDAKVRSSSLPIRDVEVGDNRKFTVKKTASVSGRVILANEYPAAPWLYAVVLGLGSAATDDATFGTWTSEFDGDGYKVNAPQYAVVFLMFGADKPKLKPGDYLSVVGEAGVPEQDHMIVRGTDNANCWTIKVEKFETR